jgi:hypothetical protein
MLNCLQIAKKELMTSLQAIEFMDWESASIHFEHSGAENPLDEKYEYYILIESAGN